MKFCVNIEQVDDEDGGLIWQATVDEYPDLAEFNKDPVEAGMLAIEAAICLRIYPGRDAPRRGTGE